MNRSTFAAFAAVLTLLLYAATGHAQGTPRDSAFAKVDTLLCGRAVRTEANRFAGPRRTQLRTLATRCDSLALAQQRPIVVPPPPAVIANVTVTLLPSITVGQTTQATATARTASGTVVAGPVVWGKDGPISVSSTGIVAGVGVGNGVVVATATNGVTGTATVAVVAAPPPGPAPVATVTLTLDGAVTQGVWRMGLGLFAAGDTTTVCGLTTQPDGSMQRGIPAILARRVRGDSITFTARTVTAAELPAICQGPGLLPVVPMLWELVQLEAVPGVKVWTPRPRPVP